jgi:hypothetical protein
LRVKLDGNDWDSYLIVKTNRIHIDIFFPPRQTKLKKKTVKYA